MGKKVRSARGEILDFDLLKIKEKMTTKPAPTDVRRRQDFIDKRLRRRIKKASKPAEKSTDDKPISGQNLPGTEDLGEEQKFIEPKTTEVKPLTEEVPPTPLPTKDEKTKKKGPRQRARPLRPDE